MGTMRKFKVWHCAGMSDLGSQIPPDVVPEVLTISHVQFLATDSEILGFDGSLYVQIGLAAFDWPTAALPQGLGWIICDWNNAGDHTGGKVGGTCPKGIQLALAASSLHLCYGFAISLDNPTTPVCEFDSGTCNPVRLFSILEGLADLWHYPGFITLILPQLQLKNGLLPYQPFTMWGIHKFESLQIPKMRKDPTIKVVICWNGTHAHGHLDYLSLLQVRTKDAARTHQMPVGCPYDKCHQLCPLCDVGAPAGQLRAFSHI
ncbi:hypothetical protein DFH07DRAFT_777460 [Mycena maculata]|uniref:Uncharacterized protein n=1 Tax=Mycena maculata TaxID=230809 RepID=A0AAD7N2V0_9AGAR|nr:hypothetical protein DFH07DRAFT_777460 [Mycena maculata]